MNYYRRFVGDYGKRTKHLSLMEHGVYSLLLDAYYSTEAPLPAKHERLYRICSAIAAPEKEAVRTVADDFFPIASDGLRHNERADEELKIAQPAIAAARTNGKGGGRPKKHPQKTQDKPNGFSGETQGITHEEPVGGHPSSTIHQPEPKIPSEKRFPGRDGSPDSASAFGAAALEKLKPTASPAGRIEGGEETPAGVLSRACLDNGIRANPFHPLVVEWARDGFTVDDVKRAITTARQRKGDGSIPPAYLDPILRDTSKPIDTGWKRDDAKASVLCGELGIPGPKRGEDMPAFHSRIEQALAARARSQVA